MREGCEHIRCNSHHDSEPLCTDVEWEDLQSVCNQHRGVCDVVEEIKDEDERDGCCRRLVTCMQFVLVVNNRPFAAVLSSSVLKRAVVSVHTPKSASIIVNNCTVAT